MLIEKWLNGSRNYFVGVALLQTYGNDHKLLTLLQSGATAYNKQRLVEALQSIVANKPKLVAKASVDTDVMPDSKDQVLMAIKNKWMPLYQRMNYLRHELDKYPGNWPAAIAAREPIVKEVMDLERQIIKLWQTSDHYKEHGKLPDEDDKDWPVPTDPLALANAISNCKKNIRRNRKLMTDNPDKPTYAKLYADYKQYHLKLTGEHYEEKD